MRFLTKSLISTLFGFFGGWLGDFIGFGTSIFLGFTLSVIGWYLAKYWLDRLEM